MSEWISVKDRLPKRLEDVLAYRKDGRMVIAWMADDGVFLCEDTWSEVTHWLPLPESPEKENRKEVNLMDDIKTLLMNQIRGALSQLEQIGVGHTDLEHTNEIVYVINDMQYVIDVYRKPEE